MKKSLGRIRQLSVVSGQWSVPLGNGRQGAGEIVRAEKGVAKVRAGRRSNPMRTPGPRQDTVLYADPEAERSICMSSTILNAVSLLLPDLGTAVSACHPARR